MAKNIVICCDGTGNEVAGFPTNVLRLFHVLVRDTNQIAYYDGGVGTLVDPTSFTRWRKWVRRKLDGAIGNSLRSNFCHAYQFLAAQYQPGDRIFLLASAEELIPFARWPVRSIGSASFAPNWLALRNTRGQIIASRKYSLT